MLEDTSSILRKMFPAVTTKRPIMHWRERELKAQKLFQLGKEISKVNTEISQKILTWIPVPALANLHTRNLNLKFDYLKKAEGS